MSDLLAFNIYALIATIVFAGGVVIGYIFGWRGAKGAVRDANIRL